MAAIARTVTGSDAPDAWSVELEPARRGAAAEAALSEPRGRRDGDGARGAAAGDVAAVAAAVGELLVELGGGGPRRAELEAEIRACSTDRGAGALLVAEAERGRIVGVLAASWQRAIHVPGRYATIQDLWVASGLAQPRRSARNWSRRSSSARERGGQPDRGRPAARELRSASPRPRPSTCATGSSTSARGCGGSSMSAGAADGRAAPAAAAATPPTGCAKAAASCPGSDDNRRMVELRARAGPPRRRARRSPPTPTAKTSSRRSASCTSPTTWRRWPRSPRSRW